MSRLLLVPGGWQGAWAYDRVIPLLRDANHDPRALTLSGLGPDAGRGCPPNLDSHIEDVLRALQELGGQTILVAHSYGGMAITGAAERAPELVAGLVYVDAYVPSDGDSCWSLTSERFRRAIVRGAGVDGAWVRPSDSEPRARPHPLGSLLQRIRLGAGAGPAMPRDYVFLSGWSGSPFVELYSRLRRDPAWRTHELACGHNVALEEPATLARLLVSIAGRIDLQER